MRSMSRTVLLDEIMEHHDYVWARLPFVGPMALAVARRRPEPMADELARLIIELRPIVLEHLDHEERLLGGHALAATWIRAGMHADHAMIASALDRIREAVARSPWSSEPGADELECTLRGELALLDQHVSAQISLEEELVEKQLDEG
jgi:hypothetical protein